MNLNTFEGFYVSSGYVTFTDLIQKLVKLSNEVFTDVTKQLRYKNAVSVHHFPVLNSDFDSVSYFQEVESIRRYH